MQKREDLIILTTVKSEMIKLDCLKDTELEEFEFKIRQLSVEESENYLDILEEKKKENISLKELNAIDNKAIDFAVSRAMVEPTYFTKEEKQNMNGIGNAIIQEIFHKIPLIGMNKKQKEKYYKTIAEIEQNIIDKNIEKIKADEVEEEKK